MSSKIKASVASYYKNAPATHRATLVEMRKRILKVVPQSTEVISYGMPAFKVDGIIVAGLRVNKSTIGYYPFSGSVLKKYTRSLKGLEITKASLQVPLGLPLAQSLVKTLIKARLSSCPVRRGEIDLERYERQDALWRELKIAAPARRGLVNRRLLKLADLSRITESEFLAIHGVGTTASKIIKDKMRTQRISFKKQGI